MCEDCFQQIQQLLATDGVIAGRDHPELATTLRYLPLHAAADSSRACRQPGGAASHLPALTALDLCARVGGEASIRLCELERRLSPMMTAMTA